MLKRNFILVIYVTLIGSICGFLFSFFQTNNILEGLLHGLADGMIIAFLLSFYSMIIVEYLFKKQFRKIPFTLHIIINSSIYLFLILFGRAMSIVVTMRAGFVLFPDNKHFIGGVVYAVFLSIVINSLFQISSLLGQGVLPNFFLGKYHQYKEEERIFMFLDIKSSTTIAEKIGNKAYLKLLDKFFYDMTEPLLIYGGEIYKYVGDEAIISWKYRTGLKNNNCINFFFSFLKILNKNKPEYKSQFSIFPEFRAGLHSGEVVTGEMGEIKKEIVYMGDVVNTTARILDQCKEMESDFMVSQEIINGISNDSGKYDIKSIGEKKLRGKKNMIELFSIA